MLRPKACFDKITDIKPHFFKENNIKAVIVDVDNTLIDLDRKPLENIEEWVDNLKKENIKICIASNSVKKEKIMNLANKLDIPYVYGSMKPFARGLKRAIKIIGEKEENIAEIGDQLFTDVLGANRLSLFSILTKPFSPEKHRISKLKRKVEQICIKKMNLL